jgi:Domain of unknown function (DUF3797)
MKLRKVLELMLKYSQCGRCGNDSIGAGEGSLHVETNSFLRICKCGWAIEVVDGKETVYNANH